VDQEGDQQNPNSNLDDERSRMFCQEHTWY